MYAIMLLSKASFKKMSVNMFSLSTFYCARFANLRNLQNSLRSFRIAHVQFANFWPKPDPQPELRP